MIAPLELGLVDLFDQADDETVVKPRQAPCPTGLHDAAVIDKTPCGCTLDDAALVSCRWCQGATTKRGLEVRGHVSRAGRWCVPESQA